MLTHGAITFLERYSCMRKPAHRHQHVEPEQMITCFSMLIKPAKGDCVLTSQAISPAIDIPTNRPHLITALDLFRKSLTTCLRLSPHQRRMFCILVSAFLDRPLLLSRLLTSRLTLWPFFLPTLLPAYPPDSTRKLSPKFRFHRN